jgi:hypothetical protein
MTLERVAEARRAAIAAGQICPFCESLRTKMETALSGWQKWFWFRCGTKGAIDVRAALRQARRTLLCIEREKQDKEAK